MVAIALGIHLLSAIIWVGGMFFAFMIIRPIAADMFENHIRLKLWVNIFDRFFRWVLAIIVLLPITGYFMIFQNWDGFKFITIDIHMMHILGIIMILIFLHLYFAPYRRLKLALDDNNLKEAGRRLNQIRIIIAVNLSLGLLVSLVASMGRYWPSNWS